MPINNVLKDINSEDYTAVSSSCPVKIDEKEPVEFQILKIRYCKCSVAQEIVVGLFLLDFYFCAGFLPFLIKLHIRLFKMSF